MNRCGACGQDFSSVEAFDRHQVGRHAYTFDEGLDQIPPREDGRRCLSIEEMTAAAWAIDRRGRWVHPRELRKRLKRGGDGSARGNNAATPTHRSSPRLADRKERITAAGGDA